MNDLWCDYLFVMFIFNYVIIMLRRRFRVNLHFIVAWMSRNSLLKTGEISEVEVKVIGSKPTTIYFV